MKPALILYGWTFSSAPLITFKGVNHTAAKTGAAKKSDHMTVKKLWVTDYRCDFFFFFPLFFLFFFFCQQLTNEYSLQHIFIMIHHSTWKNCRAAGQFSAASTINNLLMIYICFEILIFLQRLNSKSITVGGGGLIISFCSWALSEQGPQLPVCHCGAFWCAVASVSGKGSRGLIFSAVKWFSVSSGDSTSAYGGGGYQWSESN